ncbi:N/A [soil metagenome]
MAALRQVLSLPDAAGTVGRLGRADDAVEGRFTFLNETREFVEIDWARRYGNPLWSFNLQYCAYTEDLARACVATGDPKYSNRLGALIRTWIAQSKPLTADAWAPYAIARRLVHWTRAFLLASDRLDSALSRAWLASIASQTDFLARTIEWHLLGNHVVTNLHGVLAGASLLEGRRFEVLAKRAAEKLWREARFQVLPDGVHCERSPMYHAGVMSDLLGARAVASAMRLPVPAALDKLLPRMADALTFLTRPDGTYHLFNDCANQDPAYVLELVSLARDGTGGHPVWSASDAGYFGARTTALRFIVDCGPLGPDHQPAHGHCDLLSFELDIDGTPVVVDSGTGGYDDDPLRAYWRSTRAHNTIQVNDLEQHELWGTFRAARRARLRHVEYCTSDGPVFTGAYSPYYSSRVLHTRRIRIWDDGLQVEDSVEGAEGATIRSFVHLHPDVRLEVSGGHVGLAFKSGFASVDLVNVGRMRVLQGKTGKTQGWHAAQFGVAQAATVLELHPEDSAATFGYRITRRG